MFNGWKITNILDVGLCELDTADGPYNLKNILNNMFQPSRDQAAIKEEENGNNHSKNNSKRRQ